MTSSPGCASGSAATPPAAPSPMMTTSVSFSLVAIRHSSFRLDASAGRVFVILARLGERLVVVRGLVIRLQIVFLEPLLIGGGDIRPHPRISDQIPADEVRVAAVVRIAEGALMSVIEQQRKKLRRAPRESSR